MNTEEHLNKMLDTSAVKCTYVYMSSRGADGSNTHVPEAVVKLTLTVVNLCLFLAIGRNFQRIYTRAQSAI
jgi:hypothetical protein